MTQSTFATLDLIEPLQRALRAENYTTPTPIQAQAIPQLLAGRDLLGCAQTGTGKTAAFALPILQKLTTSQMPLRPRGVRALILTPTRELALQINDSFQAYGRFLRISTTVVMGGVGHAPQIRALSRGIDVLIATPGRLNDLLEQRQVHLDQVEVFVLDEADRMLDMGFIRDVRKIIAGLPPARQTMLFSATMPGDIARLASSILREPVRVEVTPVASTAERIEQKVLLVDKGSKHRLLVDVLKDPAIARAIIFTRTKHGANKVGEVLARGQVMAEVIHGNKSQSARQKALENFRAGRSRALVATDIAARGIDVDGITHVINFDLPNEPESYVHRIGRTARAGAAGFAISFCDQTERGFLRDIEKLIRMRVPSETVNVSGASRAETLATPAGDERAPHGRQGQLREQPREQRSPRRGQDKRRRDESQGKSRDESQGQPRLAAKAKPRVESQGKPHHERQTAQGQRPQATEGQRSHQNGPRTHENGQRRHENGQRPQAEGQRPRAAARADDQKPRAADAGERPLRRLPPPAHRRDFGDYRDQEQRTATDHDRRADTGASKPGAAKPQGEQGKRTDHAKTAKHANQGGDQRDGAPRGRRRRFQRSGRPAHAAA